MWLVYFVQNDFSICRCRNLGQKILQFICPVPPTIRKRSSTVQSTIKHGNMDLGPLSQLTKATNVFLDLQQRLCQGWPPPSDNSGPSASSSSISAAAKLTSLSIFTLGSESSGGVVVTFSLKFGGYQALHLHCQIHDSWGPRRVHHHQCLEEDGWY